MLGSTSTYFQQPKIVLRSKREDVENLLAIKGYSRNEINCYLKAYDFFCNNNKAFDGATIVKDLFDIPNLDLDAMLHDYHYIFLNTGASLHSKWLADYIYFKGNIRKGKGQYNAYSRLVGLCMISVVFVPYRYFQRGRISNQQKENLVNDYKILVK